MPDWITYLIPALIIAAVTAYLTVLFSYRSFRKERLWERRADAYTSILEALHHLKRDFDEDWSDAQQQTNRDVSEELKAKIQAALEAVDKAVDLAAFLMSDEAAKILTRLDRETEEAKKAGDYSEFLAIHTDAVETALEHLRVEARRDLQ